MASEEKQEEEPFDGPLALQAKTIARLRPAYDAALRLVTTYDGSEVALQEIVRQLSIVDGFMREVHGRGGVTESLEARYARLVMNGQHHSGLSTISQFLDAAQDHYLAELQNAKDAEAALTLLSLGGALLDENEFYFLPPDADEPGIIPGDGTGIKEAEFDETRLPRLLIVLQEMGIYSDDIHIMRGRVTPSQMRRRPYMLVSIPRRNVEIAVCEQVGEALFISTQTLGPAIWATRTKAQLQAEHGVQRVVMNPGWEDDVRIILQGAAPGGKIAVKEDRRKAFPLTEDFIADLMWRFFEIHGEFPGRNSGNLAELGLPGETWSALDSALIGRKQEDGTIKRVRGLAGGSSLQKLAVNKGWRLADPLTEDIIVRLMARYYRIHKKFPGEDSGSLAELGLPGENWSALNIALRQGCRGLTGGSSSRQLAIKKGWRLADPLSEEIIDDLMWRYYEIHHGEFPSQYSGSLAELGLPGETWMGFTRALAGNRQPDETMKGQRGLSGGSSLRQIAIKKGWCLADPLSEEIIANLMWRYYEIHGKFSSQNSGSLAELGLPGETWVALNHALRGIKQKDGSIKCLRGLMGGSSLSQFRQSQFFKDYSARYGAWRAAAQFGPVAPSPEM